MKRYIRSANTNEELMSALSQEAYDIIREWCNNGALDEYPDDVRWGNNAFSISIYRGRGTFVTDFTFSYDEDDTFDRDAHQQMRDDLQEFLERRLPIDDYDVEYEEHTGQDYVEDAIEDVTYEAWHRYQHSNKDQQDLYNIIVDKLAKSPYNLVEGEDYKEDDIVAEIDDYFWN